MMRNERNYGIDLLRLVLMYMVCILHTLGQGGILGACEKGTAAYNAFWFIEILSYCAVDGFAIISGYTAADKPQKFEKLANMWFQAFFYSFIVTAILTIAGLNPEWSTQGLIKLAQPVTFDTFWYFTAFFALFFAIPLLNRFVFSADERTARIALILLFVLFSCIELRTGVFKTQKGYSALWIMVLYCIGALAKRGKVFEQKRTITLVAMWAVCILITWCVHVFWGTGRLTNYVSPTILASGLLMVILFSRIKTNGTVISKLSPLTFGIYLFQLNPVIWNNCLKGRNSFAAQANIAVGIAYAFGIAALIFIAGLFVELIRSKLAKAIRIPVLSCKIVNLVKWLLQRAASIKHGKFRRNMVQ